MCDNFTRLHTLLTNGTVHMQPTERRPWWKVKFKRLLRDGSGEQKLMTISHCLQAVVWKGVGWCGVVVVMWWCGAVWCDVVVVAVVKWCGVVWRGWVSCVVVLFGVAW